METKLYFCEHADCRVCTETVEKGFEYIETQKGEKYVFEMTDSYTIAFILKGSALVSCNEYIDVPFKEGEIIIWPTKSQCSWESLSDTAAIVMQGSGEMLPCDRIALKGYADYWLNAIPQFKGLAIKPRLMEFLISVKNYLNDGITCPHIHKSKQYELATIFRAYYSPDELMSFFLPIIKNTHEFEHFIMDNYLHMKGVKEFVDLSGMNLSTFNRKFKAHFKESPYQWIIKQKSKHIYHELSTTDNSLASIARNFHFSDASHFNRYCKSKFGASPSEIRKIAAKRKS